jgi:hypothetical protein
MAPVPTSRRETAERVATYVAAAALFMAWALRWPKRSRYPYEWDSASYILGAEHFDVFRHHPHPPGYPLYILILKAARIFTTDLNTAQVVLAFVFTAAAAVITFRFARSFHGRAAAILASVLVLFAPPVALYDSVANNYPFDLLDSALVGWMAARVWEGESDLGPWVSLALGLFAGFRESGALMMVPLVALALARSNRVDLVRWGKCLAVFVATTASWYLPTAAMHGGVVRFQRFCDETLRGYCEKTSVLCGAPASMHETMLGNVARWALLTFAVATLTTATSWALARLLRKPESKGRFPRPGLAFYAAWILPNAAYVTLFQCNKPGYIILSVPPVMILLAAAVGPSFVALGDRLRVSGTTVAAAAACFSGLLSTAVTCHSFRSFAFRRATLASALQADEETRAIDSVIGTQGGTAAGTMVIYFSWPWYGPTPQSMMLRHPESDIAVVLPSGVMETHRNGQVFETATDEKPVPADIQRILWIWESEQPTRLSLPPSLSGARHVFSGPLITGLATDVDEAPIDARVGYGDGILHLLRPAAASALPPG